MFKTQKVFWSHTEGLFVQYRVLWDGYDKEVTLVTLAYSPESKKHKDIIHLCFPIRDSLAANLKTKTMDQLIIEELRV